MGTRFDVVGQSTYWPKWPSWIMESIIFGLLALIELALISAR